MSDQTKNDETVLPTQQAGGQPNTETIDRSGQFLGKPGKSKDKKSGIVKINR